MPRRTKPSSQRAMVHSLVHASVSSRFASSQASSASCTPLPQNTLVHSPSTQPRFAMQPPLVLQSHPSLPAGQPDESEPAVPGSANVPALAAPAPDDGGSCGPKVPAAPKPAAPAPAVPKPAAP